MAHFLPRVKVAQTVVNRKSMWVRDIERESGRERGSVVRTTCGITVQCRNRVRGKPNWPKSKANWSRELGQCQPAIITNNNNNNYAYNNSNTNNINNKSTIHISVLSFRFRVLRLTSSWGQAEGVLQISQTGFSLSDKTRTKYSQVGSHIEVFGRWVLLQFIYR